MASCITHVPIAVPDLDDGDNDNERLCFECGLPTPEDDLDDDEVCGGCREATEDYRQQSSDYRYRSL